MFAKSDSATYALFSSFDLMNVRIAHPVGTRPERRNDFGESFDLEYYSRMRMRRRAMYPDQLVPTCSLGGLLKRRSAAITVFAGLCRNAMSLLLWPEK